MYWEQAWLNYQPTNIEDKYRSLLTSIAITKKTNRVDAAVEELVLAVEKMFGLNISVEEKEVSALTSHRGIFLMMDKSKEDHQAYGEEGYEILLSKEQICVKANTDRGLMYGVFSLIRELSMEGNWDNLIGVHIPNNPIRSLNHWDNSDGSIERGYSGRSFFFKDGALLVNDRTKDYARFMASIGINAVVINNVNVAREAIELITDRYYEALEALTEIFDRYGIRLFLSLDYAASIDVGGLDSADPLNDEVNEWWHKKMAEVYSALPKFGGFLIKADSEGRPGPFTYNRTHADGANMLAKAIQPYGGTIIWRCFVYNCQQDWRDLKTDRARAQYDNFKPLDGQFEDNVVLQIKNGPMDFQVREPVAPLFGAMPKTNQILEVQIAQEYTGQQRHICYLIPMWKEVLDFKTYCTDEKDQIADIVSGRTYGNNLCGMAAVTNMGDDANWTGHDLAAANLYGYGRLAWDTTLTSEGIAEEWIRLTFGNDELVREHILKMLMMSWPAYEKYTSPLGIGWMVNPNHHYGPNVDGYEYDRWGTYHRSDHKGMGVDRTEKGTGYVDQYYEPNASRYKSVETCPEPLLLFFHRIEYDYVLKSGKTLIQHIYDTHFEGVEDVEKMVSLWQALENKIEDKVYLRVIDRLNHQLEHSKEWRDVVNAYYHRKTMMPDEHGRKLF